MNIYSQLKPVRNLLELLLLRQTIVSAFPWNDFVQVYKSLLVVLQKAKGLKIRAGSKQKMYFKSFLPPICIDVSSNRNTREQAMKWPDSR